MADVKVINIEVPSPEFLNFLEPKAREDIIEEVKKLVAPEYAKLFEFTAQKIVSQKFNLAAGTMKEPLKKGTY